MKVIDEELLARFRRELRCELCGERNWRGLEPHHYRAKGIGGAHQKDVPENLIATCLVCHRKIHDGNVPRKDILRIIAHREGRTPEWITTFLDRLSAEPKETDRDSFLEMLRAA